MTYHQCLRVKISTNMWKCCGSDGEMTLPVACRLGVDRILKPFWDLGSIKEKISCQVRSSLDSILGSLVS